MSLISSMYTAANGLQSHSDAMSIVSDNISNVNTVGFKESTGRFTDVMAKAAGGVAGNATLGQGSQLSDAETSFAQGALLSTGSATDLAIMGDGFFMVSGATANGSGTFFTRAGQFKLDDTGKLVNFDKLAVQGYQADAQGKIGSTLRGIQVQVNNLLPPLPTANLSIIANLNPTPVAVPAWDVTQPSATSNFSNTITSFDSLGAEHEIQLYYRNSGPGAYDWYAVVNGADLSGGTTSQCANGSMTFDTNGKLTTMTTAASSFNFVDATPGQAIAFDFGDPISTGGTGNRGITLYQSAVMSSTGAPINGSVTGVASDGYAAGSFQGIQINADGTIVGAYSNDKKLVLGQLAVAKFPSIQGVERVGQTLFQSTLESGQPAIGASLTGGRGSIVSQSLEQSNVNLSNDFIQMMAYQRGFQANSRTVRTADSMLQELVNLGR
jgi:flagellar hook protein FlgE